MIIRKIEPKDCTEIMNKFYKEKEKLSFLAQVIDLSVRNSKSPKRINLLEDLDEYLKWEKK